MQPNLPKATATAPSTVITDDVTPVLSDARYAVLAHLERSMAQGQLALATLRWGSPEDGVAQPLDAAAKSMAGALAAFQSYRSLHNEAQALKAASERAHTRGEVQ